jgi:hypothetical protein
MATQSKLDLFKECRAEYTAKRNPLLVDVGPAVYLGITGQGAPGGEAFSAAIGALYAVAYTIKMTRKFAGLGDYGVCKLEGQYWGEGKESCWVALPKEQWCWQLLIRTPDFVKQKDLKSAASALSEKGKGAEIGRVQRVELREGTCVQMLHVGPYEEEGKTFDEMQEFIAGQGLRLHGRHHDIYLSDPRRVAPEKLRTILRHPVRKG